MSGPVIRTHSGRDVPLMTFGPEHVALEDIAHALAHQCRWGGHTWRFYSIAEHCLLVAALVPPAHRAYALLHDASEAYLGDVVAPLKRSSALAGYREIEARVQAAIYRAVGLDPDAVPETVHAADLVALQIEGRALFNPAIDIGPAWRLSEAHRTLNTHSAATTFVLSSVGSSAEAKTAWLATVRQHLALPVGDPPSRDLEGSAGRPTLV